MSITVAEVWSDLHHFLITGPTGSIKKVINIDSVKTSIDNILRTPKGTRVMLRTFGSDLKGMLFENINGVLTNMIADEIKRAVNTWDNRVIVNAVDFKTDADRNQVTVTVKFAIRGYDEVFSMTSVI